MVHAGVYTHNNMLGAEVGYVTATLHVFRTCAGGSQQQHGEHSTGTPIMHLLPQLAGMPYPGPSLALEQRQERLY